MKKHVFYCKTLPVILLSGMICSVPFSEIRAEKTGMDIVQQQTVKITGQVLDANNEPVVGAGVTVKGNASLGTITDIDGNFTLAVPAHSKLLISYIGFVQQEVAATPGKVIKISLKENSKMLDEVIVVGFGTQKKVNLTGAVSTVSAKELKERPVVNAVQALQGMVPGLRISQNNGSLEDKPSINVRGTTTIGEGTSGDPLILIDGMEGDLNSINPQDIANVSVLKDAAASSIYGSRAPFGVILVTTKSGSTEGKTRINYNNNMRWMTPMNLQHSMNSVDFTSWYNDANTNGGGDVFFNKEHMERIVAYHNAQPYRRGQRIAADGTILTNIPVSDDGKTWADKYNKGNDDIDWIDMAYRKWTFSQEHNFSVDGGSKKLNYYASMNYMNQSGLMKVGEEGLDRFTGTAKINSQVTNWLSFNYTMRFTREDFIRPAELRGDFYPGLVRQGWPTVPYYDPNGYEISSYVSNLEYGGKDTKQTDNIYHQLGLSIEPIKNWVTNINFNYRIQSANRHWDTQVVYEHDVEGNPYPNIWHKNTSVHEDYWKQNYYNFNATSQYSHTFNKKHNFLALIGFQAENAKQTQFGLSRSGVIIADKPVIDITNGLDADGKPVTPSVNGQLDEWAIAGFFGRINYDYQGKYLAEVNIRTDGSSRFRKENRWKTFPSFSLGWNIAHENFFEPINDIVNTLKIRGSFGMLGNQNTSNWYQTYQTMAVKASNGSWLMNGIKPNIASAPGLVSTSLTWETVQTYNIGLDWGLFNNRLSGSFEYYVRDTKNMVGNAPDLPSILGTDVPKTNNTDLRTKGWELQIGWNDRLDNGLAYGAKFNIYDSRTKITRYPNNPTNDIGKRIAGMYTGEIWGYTTKGLARTDEEMQAHLATLPEGGQNAIGSSWAAGDIMYADINGDGKIDGGKGVLGDTGDLSIIGNSASRYLFGLDLNANWKGFDLRLFFQGVAKRDYWIDSIFMFGSTDKGQWHCAGTEPIHNYFRSEDTWSVKEGYQSANLDGYLPRPLWSNKNLRTQTRYLQNAAYVRLKNLQIGYTFPQKWISRWNIQNLRLFFSGDNLYTVTGLDKQFDPETISSHDGGGYPLSTTLSFGLSVTL